MWKYELFADTIREVVEKSKSSANPFTAVMLYAELEKVIGYRPETIKGWGKANNNGPSDPDAVLKLEQYFGVSFVDEKEKKEKVKIMNGKYSDFVKSNIQFCFEEMRAFLVEMKGCGKEYYHILFALKKTRDAIKNKRFGMPQDIYDEIMEYIDNEFQPFVDDLETVLAPVRTPEFEPKYINGKIQPMSRELIDKKTAIYNEIFFGYFERLDEFALKAFYPILMS